MHSLSVMQTHDKQDDHMARFYQISDENCMRHASKLQRLKGITSVSIRTVPNYFKSSRAFSEFEFMK